MLVIAQDSGTIFATLPSLDFYKLKFCGIHDCSHSRWSICHRTKVAAFMIYAGPSSKSRVQSTAIGSNTGSVRGLPRCGPLYNLLHLDRETLHTIW